MIKTFAYRWSQEDICQQDDHNKAVHQQDDREQDFFYLLVKYNDPANTVFIHVSNKAMKWHRTQPNIVHKYKS